MVFNETWDPGWILTINGIKKEIYLANRAYMGAILETGNNVIEFNDSLNSEINDDKKRSFWNLLKY